MVRFHRQFLIKPKTMQNKLSKLEKNQIAQNQIIRLAKIFLSKPVSLENQLWHMRVVNIQLRVTNENKS